MSLAKELSEAVEFVEGRIGDPKDIASEADRERFVSFATKAMQASLGAQLRKNFPDLSEKLLTRIKARAADGFTPKLTMVLNNIGRAAKR